VNFLDGLATRSGKRIVLHLINRSFDRDALIRVEGVAGEPQIQAIVQGAMDCRSAVRMEGARLHLPAQVEAAVAFESP